MAGGGTGGNSFISSGGAGGQTNPLGTGGAGSGGSFSAGGGGGGAGTTGGAGSVGGNLDGATGGAGGAGATSAGGAGGNGQTGAGGGGGGGGGANGSTLASSTMLSKGTYLAGGAGGNGGDSISAFGGGGGGGGAGAYGGAFSGSGLTLTIASGAGARGGAGGLGGNVEANGGAYGASGSGGSGGGGLYAGSGNIIVNHGVIIGGAGGSAGANYANSGVAGSAGAGGAGIIGANLSVVNTGLISGGVSGDGATQADAITFTSGDDNSLTLGGALSGAIGVTGRLTIVTDGDAALANTIHDASGGAGAIAYDSGSKLTLSGTNSYSGGTYLEGGTVAAANTAAFGSGTVHALGGTIEFSATGVYSNAIELDLASSTPTTFDVDAGVTATLSHAITTGTGSNLLNQTIDTSQSIVVSGAGTLTFAGANSYSGGTYLESGTVDAANTAAFGSGTIHALGGTIEFSATGAYSNAIELDMASATPTMFDVDAGVTATLSHAITTGAGSNLLNQTIDASQPIVVSGAGTLVLSSSASTFSGGVTIEGGALELDAFESFAGSTVIEGPAGTGAITFAGNSNASSTLILDNGLRAVRNSLVNFGANDDLDLKGFTFSSDDAATVSGNTLTFSDSEGFIEYFILSGSHDSDYFVHPDGADGILINDIAPPTVSVATFEPGGATGDLAILDTASAISAGLASLNEDSDITSLTISNNAAVSIAVSQLTSDATTIGKLANANGKAYQLAISDSGTNVKAALSTIESDLSHIGSITLTGGSVTASAAQFDAYEGALNKIAGGFAVSDSAAYVSAALAALNSDSHVAAITISDNAALSVTAGQLTADAAALAKLANANGKPYQLAVSGAAGSVIAALATIESDVSHIASIAVTTGTVTASTSQLQADEDALNKIVGTFNVSDTASAVQNVLATLTAEAGHIKTIAATGGKVTVTAAQFQTDRAALDKIAGGFAVSDTAAATKAALAALSADATRVSTIVETSGTVAVTTAQFAAYEAALNKIGGGFDVSDSASAVQGALAGLKADASHIDAITATGATVVATTALFLADETLLNEIGGGFSISDLAANVGAHIDALEADQAHIKSIAFTNAVTPALQVTAAQATADASIIAKIKGPYALDTHETDGSWAIAGHGNAVTIADIIGVDTINGGGTSDVFVFKAGFGQAAILDNSSHWTGAGHDVIQLAKSEFASFAAVLSDASVAQGHVVISATNGDKLTLDGFTSLTQFNAAAADFKFV